MKLDRIRTILLLALPIMAAQLSQNILNVVDLIIVGKLGTAAVAAVGFAGFLSFLASSVLMGLGAGVQAIAARRIGEDRENDAAIPLNGGLFLVAIIGVPIVILLFWISPWLFSVMINDPEVEELATIYYRARLIGVIAVGANFCYRGYWNGTDRSMVYMRTMVGIHLVNVVLTVCLVFGYGPFPELGVLGAGLGTALSLWVGVILYHIQVVRQENRQGYLTRTPRGETMASMIKLSVPNSLQLLFFSLGFVVLFWIFAQIGTAELAAANVLVTMVLLAVLPGMGLGMASATLVGKAIGKGANQDAKSWAWEVSRVAVIIVGLIGLALLSFPTFFAGLFLSEAEPLALARLPLMVTGAVIAIDAVGQVLQVSLASSGDARFVMQRSILVQWGIFLPIAVIAALVFSASLLVVWCLFLAYRGSMAVIFFLAWRKERWVGIKV